MAPVFSSVQQQVRGIKSNNPQAQAKKAKEKTKKTTKKGPRIFKQSDLKSAQQFSLCEAMRWDLWPSPWAWDSN